MPKLVSWNAKETRAFAGKMIKNFVGKKKSGPLVLALSGELGSGKTTFVQGLARTLGITGKLRSPTFILMKSYKLPKRLLPFQLFTHVDVYRLNNSREMKRLGFDEMVQDIKAITVIEWADKAKGLIPKGAIWIKFKHRGRNSREISFRK